jgi:glycosyltransferase involved in cell wall biosynthesis
MSSRKNYLIYTAVTTWNEPPRARHQVANELKKDGTVYFVEKNKTGSPRLEIRKVEDHVYVITPYYWLLYKVRYRTPLINERYHRWLLSSIRDMKVDFEMVISFDYTAPAIHDFFENVVFYCADDNVGFGKFNPWFINNYHTKTEEKVARKARLCIVTSDYMGGKIGAYNPNTHVIPLGAPVVVADHIRPPRKASVMPVIGLVGYLDSNLDFPLIEKMLKQFRIIFIGPVNDKNRKWLSSFPNATLLGPKTGKSLHDCLGEVDVCVAPYDLRKINKGATPNKMWLYLSLGKPAVVTNIPNIRNWVFEEKILYKCDNDCFIDTCIRAYREDTMELALKRVEFAKMNSWENRVGQIRDLYYQDRVPEAS